MYTKYYERFQTYPAEKLFKIILNPSDFQDEAVQTAKKIVEEKNWTEALNLKKEEKIKLQIIAEENETEEIETKAAYYNEILDYQTNGFSFEVRIADFAKLEGALYERGIPFYRADKNIGVQLDAYPTQTYYFKNKDKMIVDDLTKEIGLLTLPYADIKPFFFFTAITFIAATIFFTVLIFILYRI